ncbi:Beta-fructofuranosidase [Bertholletia excelsa]
MNDPNGPLIYKGIYHLFYQYIPEGVAGAKKVWAHSVSKDLVNWTPLPLAIYPSQPAGDINGCWSGSATILPNGKPAIVYTGIDPQNRQVQNYAEPKNLSDPYLIELVKLAHNPVMAPTAQNRINASSFRDPTTGWFGPDDLWRVIVGSKRDSLGLAILYRSTDFVRWTEATHPLPERDVGVPGLFPVARSGIQSGLDTCMVGLGIKHVLKSSLDDTKHDYYTIGTYDNALDRYTPDEGSVDGDSGLRYDYGKFYASKTFYDSAKKRRILWGWINESLPTVEYVKQGWSGVQAIPRKVWLYKSGKQLVQWPIPEIEKLRTNPVSLTSEVLKSGSRVEISHVTAAQADVEISFEALGIEEAEEPDPGWINPQVLRGKKGASVKGGLGPFGLQVLASKDLKEYTAVFIRIFKKKLSRTTSMWCSCAATKAGLLQMTNLIRRLTEHLSTWILFARNCH